MRRKTQGKYMERDYKPHLGIKKTGNSFIRMPKGAIELKRLAHELMEWAMQDDAVVLQDFIKLKRLSPISFRNLYRDENNEEFRAAVEFAKACCYTRLIKNETRVHFANVTRLMPLYDIFYSDYLDARESKDQSKNANFVIEMPPISSEIMPRDTNPLFESND